MHNRTSRRAAAGLGAAAAVVAALAFSAASRPVSPGAPDAAADSNGAQTRTIHAQGWSSNGRTQVTAEEVVNADGTGSLTLLEGGVSVEPSQASARAARRAAPSSGPRVTYDDLVAYVNDTSITADNDQGPQANSDGEVTYYPGTESTARTSAPTGHRAIAAGSGSVNGGLPEYDCASLSTSEDDVHFRICTQYIFKKAQDGHTFFAAKGVGSAWSTDTNCTDCDRIEKFAAWNDMSDNNTTVFDWAPESTVTIGGCTQKTTTASTTWKGTQVSSSAAETVCPEKFGGYGPALTNSSSGSFWALVDAPTVPKDDTRGTHFVQLNDWDRGTTLYLASHGQVWWD